MQYDTIKKEIITAHILWPINAGTFDFYNYLKTKPAYVLSLMLRDNEIPTKLRDEIIFYMDRGS